MTPLHPALFYMILNKSQNNHLHIFKLIVNRERKRVSSNPLVHFWNDLMLGLGWVKARRQNSNLGDRNPVRWAITCYRWESMLVSSWIQKLELGIEFRDSNTGHGPLNSMLIARPLICPSLCFIWLTSDDCTFAERPQTEFLVKNRHLEYVWMGNEEKL